MGKYLFKASLFGLAVLFCLGRYFYVQRELNQNKLFGLVRDEPATVVGMPDQREYYTFLVLQVKKTKVRAKVSRYTTLLPGDQIKISGEIKEPPTASFDPDNDFNYQAYLARFGMTGLLDYPQISPTLAVDWRYKPLAWLYQTRRWLEGVINRLLPEPEASFLAGLLVGTRRSIPQTTLDDLTKTGTVHIIAVSGANVVIIAGIILYALRYATMNNTVAFWGSQLTIWLFVVLTGGTAAAVRGGIVSSISQTANFLGREVTITKALLFPAWLTIAINPLIWTDIGWQLSFAAFAGIILLPKWWEQKLVWFKLPPILKMPLVETLCATTGVLPVSVYHFGAFSLTTLVANPAIMWLIPLAMSVGFAATILSWLLPFLVVPLRLLAIIPLKTILLIVHWLALIPGSYFKL